MKNASSKAHWGEYCDKSHNTKNYLYIIIMFEIEKKKSKAGLQALVTAHLELDVHLSDFSVEWIAFLAVPQRENLLH